MKAVNSTIPFLAAKLLKAVKALLVAGADIKTRDLGGRSALDWAATNAHADLLKLILKHGGADWNSCDLQGRTALHRAAESDAHPADVEDAIKALVDGGADTEFLNEQVCTPLMHATRRFDCEEIMLALMRNGANPNARGLRNNTPLHEACMGQFVNLGTVVDLLLRWGADENALNDDGMPPEATLDSSEAVYFCGAEEIARARRLLNCAEQDRIWRRRGWLVVLHSRAPKDDASGDIIYKCGGGGSGDGDEDEEVDEARRAGRVRRRTGESAADRGGGGHGSDARDAAKGFSLMKMLPKIPEDVLRTLVSFL